MRRRRRASQSDDEEEQHGSEPEYSDRENSEDEKDNINKNEKIINQDKDDKKVLVASATLSLVKDKPLDLAHDSVQDETETGKNVKNPNDPTFVPTSGRFYMHDNREGGRGRGRRRNSWDKNADDQWVHDKFREQGNGEQRKKPFSSRRGRGGDRTGPGRFRNSGRGRSNFREGRNEPEKKRKEYRRKQNTEERTDNNNYKEQDSTKPTQYYNQYERNNYNNEYKGRRDNNEEQYENIQPPVKTVKRYTAQRMNSAASTPNAYYEPTVVPSYQMNTNKLVHSIPPYGHEYGKPYGTQVPPLAYMPNPYHFNAMPYSSPIIMDNANPINVPVSPVSPVAPVAPVATIPAVPLPMPSISPVPTGSAYYPVYPEWFAYSDSKGQVYYPLAPQLLKRRSPRAEEGKKTKEEAGLKATTAEFIPASAKKTQLNDQAKEFYPSTIEFIPYDPNPSKVKQKPTKTSKTGLNKLSNSSQGNGSSSGLSNYNRKPKQKQWIPKKSERTNDEVEEVAETMKNISISHQATGGNEICKT